MLSSCFLLPLKDLSGLAMNMELENTVKLDKSWLQELEPEFKKQYMKDLKFFLQSEKKKGKEIYPKWKDMLRTLNLTPLDQVKSVIIGQDPSHGHRQAHGLCFSYPEAVSITAHSRTLFIAVENVFCSL